MIVGLTGGIATGKSTVSSIFKDFGVKIVDADKVAKEITNFDSNKLEIIKIFGNDIVDQDGNLLREKIKERAFNDKSLIAKLNNLIHPQVIEYFKNEMERVKKDTIVIWDVPLLFETKLDRFCDIVIVVTIPVEEQIKRVMIRDNISEVLAKKIIDKQLSVSYKISHSDIVIDNCGDLEELKAKVRNIYDILKSKVKNIKNRDDER